MVGLVQDDAWRTLTIEGAFTRGATGLRMECFTCKKMKTFDIFWAAARFGPQAQIYGLAWRYRCSVCRHPLYSSWAEYGCGRPP